MILTTLGKTGHPHVIVPDLEVLDGLLVLEEIPRRRLVGRHQLDEALLESLLVGFEVLDEILVELLEGDALGQLVVAHVSLGVYAALELSSVSSR